MSEIETHDAITAACRAEAIALVGTVEAATGRRPLSDQSWLDLVATSEREQTPLAVHAHQDGRLIGHAQLGRTNESWSLELVLHPDLVADERLDLIATLVGEATRTVATHGGGTVYWWASDVDSSVQQLAESLGVLTGRTLHQMRVDLPLDDSAVASAHLDQLPTRSFAVGRDEAAWLEVNNAAFQSHAEQGGWDEATLRQRELEPWFDPEGFLLHERDGRLAGFCWTKIHPPTSADDSLGEIYVIAVHPDFHRAGLGRALTVAGLVSLAGRGVRTGMLYVDGENAAAIALYRSIGFAVHHTDQAYVIEVDAADLPRWSVSDVHPSLTSRSFVDAMEAMASDVDRLEVAFDDEGIRAVAVRQATADDAAAAARVLNSYNATAEQLEILEAYVYATVATDTRDEQAQALLSEIESTDARMHPLVARLADWVHALDPEALAAHDPLVADHVGPLLRLAERASHQMSEPEEGLYAELATTGSSAWSRLQRDVTSQLVIDVAMPDGPRPMPMPAVRGLGTHPDVAVRKAAYAAEMEAWPRVATACAAAMNAIKGEANTVNRRRAWAAPLDASLYANSVSRSTFDAMQSAIVSSLPTFRSWMRCKARLQSSATPGGDQHSDALQWWDLVAPLPIGSGTIGWDQGIGLVREAFSSFSPSLARLVDRALDEHWIDASPRDGKVGGAFCMPFVEDRSLVLLNWSGSVESAQTTAHELGHAYHNVQLAHRTPLQRRLPMALAETASIFCETLMVETGLTHLQGVDRLALLDVDLNGANQVVVDIHSRFLFETEVFARRQRRTLGVSELNEMMQSAQADAYGDGLDQGTAHPHMWVLKPHYYGSHFYNWPYTYGLLFGLGLFAQFRADPERFLVGYDDLLSRAGMNTAEELGESFGLDVTSEGFWVASLDVIKARIEHYQQLASDLGLDPTSAGQATG
jgi:oligoendopeptidase F